MGSPPEWAESVLKKSEGRRVFVTPGEVSANRFDRVGTCDYCDSPARFYFEDTDPDHELKIAACTFHGSEIAGRLSE